jgi:hypothetical protein
VNTKTLPVVTDPTRGGSYMADFRWLEFVQRSAPKLAYAAGMMYLRANHGHKAEVVINTFYERHFCMEEVFEYAEECCYFGEVIEWLRSHLETRRLPRADVMGFLWKHCPTYMSELHENTTRGGGVIIRFVCDGHFDMYSSVVPQMTGMTVSRPKPDPELASAILQTKPRSPILSSDHETVEA